MADCMRTLNESGLREAVERAARAKPLLGVCVGEQMLFDRSEEGDTPCLGIFPGVVRRYAGRATRPSSRARARPARPTPARPAPRRPAPNCSRCRTWDGTKCARRALILCGPASDETHFYFVHSYYADPADPGLTVGETDYGVSFTCAVAAANIFAVQFHPEKSAEHGLRLYRNFVDWQP